jgi:hypothetical protein
MATTATRIVPDPTAKGQKRKPMFMAQKAKLAAALKGWRDSLTDEDRAELKRRNREAQQARWNAMLDRERKDRLAGLKAWQGAARREACGCQGEARAVSRCGAGRRRVPTGV